jgi:hypothetical protein
MIKILNLRGGCMKFNERQRAPLSVLGIVILLIVVIGGIKVDAAPVLNATTRVSVGSNGSQASTESQIYYGYYGALNNANNYYPRFISDDGQKIVFATKAPLVPEDTNNYLDVYFHNRTDATTIRISQAYDGGDGNGLSGVYGLTISNDGNVIAFASDASNLVPNDTNNKQDIFVYDVPTGLTERVSLNADGSESTTHSIEPVLDGDGSQIVYVASGLQVILLDRTNGTRQPACPPPPTMEPMPCSSPTFSADGRFLAYTQRITRPYFEHSVVLFDIANQSTAMVVIGLDDNAVEAHTPSLSADGRYLAFRSPSTRLVPDDIDDNGRNYYDKANSDIFRLDLQSGSLIQISLTAEGISPNGESYLPKISADGNRIAFLSSAWDLIDTDTNDQCNVYGNPTTLPPFGLSESCIDAFVADVSSGTMIRASVATDGTEADAATLNLSLNGDGNAVAFIATATNLVPNDTNNGCSYGGYSAFTNCADVFVHTMNDTVSNTSTSQIALPAPHPLTPLLRQITLAPDGRNGNNVSSITPQGLSSDGRYAVITSEAGNLLSTDWNGNEDIYLYEFETGQLTLISRHTNGQQANGVSFNATISGDGGMVAFYSSAMLTPNITRRGIASLFLWERATDTLISLPVETTSSENRLTFTADGEELLLQSASPTLVLSDTNEVSDMFIYYRETGTFERVSVAANGEQANGFSGNGVMSADGRYIAYYSEASNLVPDDTNEVGDIFLYDRVTDELQRIALDPNRCLGTIPCQGFQGLLSISGDGRWVGFNTDVPLVQGDNNICIYNDPRDYREVDSTDFYFYDRVTQTVRRLSTDFDGQQLSGRSVGQLSGNGQYAIFTTTDCYSNNTRKFELDLTTNVIAEYPYGTATTSALSMDGKRGAYVSESQAYLYFPLPEGWYQNFLPLIQK